VFRRTEPFADGEYEDVLDQLLRPLIGPRGRGHIPVAVSVSARKVFFATRPIQSVSRDPSPHVLLREALRSPNISVGQMVVDVLKAQPDRRPVASIAACDGQYVTDLVAALGARGLRPVRIEPGPCALRRVALRAHGAPRGAKVVLRLFLGEREAMAVLVAGGLPVVWRGFGMPRGDEAAAILSAARSMMAISRDCGVESPLAHIVLHGQPELARLLDLAWIRQQMDAPVDWFPDPPLDDGEMAFGTAIGCFRPDERSFDLAEPLKPPAGFREIVPWRAIAAQAAILAGLFGFLWYRCDCLDQACVAAQAQTAEMPPMAAADETELARQKSEAREKIAAVQKFLGTRVTWTACHRDLAACLPAGVVLTSFSGVCELEAGDKKSGKSKPRKSLIVEGKIPLAPDGAMPREIDQMINNLRSHPRLRRDFPIVELTELKQVRRLGTESPAAWFTVVCRPKESKENAAKQPPAEVAQLPEASHGR
jgi:hypothetical protein